MRNFFVATAGHEHASDEDKGCEAKTDKSLYH